LHNYAYGGAVISYDNLAGEAHNDTWIHSIPDLEQQYEWFTNSTFAGTTLNSSTTLYAIAAGANDVIYNFQYQKQPNQTLMIENYVKLVEQLINATQAQHVLVLNFPPLQVTPFMSELLAEVNLTFVKPLLEYAIIGANANLAGALAGVAVSKPAILRCFGARTYGVIFVVL
jgi:hypothetical protein